MKILVTGSSSHLAGVLLPMLCDLKTVSQVNGIDIKKGNFKHPKFSETIIDIRDPKVSQHMKACDTVIHFAFVVLRSALKNERKNRELKPRSLVTEIASYKTDRPDKYYYQIEKFVNTLK